MNFLYAAYLYLYLAAEPTSGIASDVGRTVILTVIAITTTGTCGLMFSVRDTVRDLNRKVGDADGNDGKGTGIFAKIKKHSEELERMKGRNGKIELLFRQYARDVKRMGHGGNRESDTLLQEVISDAFAEQDDSEGLR